ncbi:MAG: hypothetical protein ABI921_06935, partial [Panacibacter sp.]
MKKLLFFFAVIPILHACNTIDVYEKTQPFNKHEWASANKPSFQFIIGDTAALCTDIAYQFGQVVSEALRTVIINTTQLWCGNRFGKGL